MKLSSKWINFLSTQPETGVGYQSVTVMIAGGKVFYNLVVMNGDTLQTTNRYRDLPFEEDEIVNIQVTH